MIAYGQRKTQNLHYENGGYKNCKLRRPVIVKKAEERRRNNPLRYPRLQHNCERNYG